MNHKIIIISIRVSFGDKRSRLLFKDKPFKYQLQQSCQSLVFLSVLDLDLKVTGLPGALFHFWEPGPSKKRKKRERSLELPLTFSISQAPGPKKVTELIAFSFLGSDCEGPLDLPRFHFYYRLGPKKIPGPFWVSILQHQREIQVLAGYVIFTIFFF